MWDLDEIEAADQSSSLTHSQYTDTQEMGWTHRPNERWKMDF